MSYSIRGRSLPFKIGRNVDGSPEVEFSKSGSRIYVRFNNQPIALQEGDQNSRQLRLYAKPLVSGEGELALQKDVIGIDQSWQDVSASRATGTIYQNTTGKPIQVLFKGRNGNSDGFEVSNDGTNWLIVARGWGNGATYYSATAHACAIIPNDGFYRATRGFDKWVEMR